MTEHIQASHTHTSFLVRQTLSSIQIHKGFNLGFFPVTVQKGGKLICLLCLLKTHL